MLCSRAGELGISFIGTLSRILISIPIRYECNGLCKWVYCGYMRFWSTSATSSAKARATIQQFELEPYVKSTFQGLAAPSALLTFYLIGYLFHVGDGSNHTNTLPSSLMTLVMENILISLEFT